ncbi:unnamed protein product [Cyclocybe aegerita]|uniref:Uncharacterized protein n=1 Tax=Cyclocybe aegerita TaxID=1973307 RepID=A0A8S0VVR0_CYCAE|nr:unnamed protein product [Cyclocybe aegerita]
MMSSLNNTPTQPPPMTVTPRSESELESANQNSPKKAYKILPGHAVFLAYPLIIFTITLLILSIVGFCEDKQKLRYRHYYGITHVASILCFVVTPFTLFYLLFLIFTSWFRSRIPRSITEMKRLIFGCFNFAYVAAMTILWGFIVGENAKRAMRRDLRLNIAIIAGIELAFLCLLGVVFLFDIWQAHRDAMKEGGIRLPTTMPSIVVMINGTPYIDIPNFQLPQTSPRVSDVKVKIQEFNQKPVDIEGGEFLPTINCILGAMSTFNNTPTQPLPMIVPPRSESELESASQNSSKKADKILPDQAAFLAYPLTIFTITLLIMSIVGFFEDERNRQYRHYYPYYSITHVGSILCFVTAPFTLFYLLALVFASWLPSRVPRSIKDMKRGTFGCVNFAYIAALTILWGFIVSESGNAVTPRDLRLHITIIAGIELAFLCLLAVVFLFDIWQAHRDAMKEGGIRLPTTTPRITVVINGTPYIDIPSFQLPQSPQAFDIKAKVQDFDHQSINTKEPLPTYNA